MKTVRRIFASLFMSIIFIGCVGAELDEGAEPDEGDRGEESVSESEQELLPHQCFYTYYSNASKTQEVGECFHSCYSTQLHCYGTKTSYVTKICEPCP